MIIPLSWKERIKDALKLAANHDLHCHGIDSNLCKKADPNDVYGYFMPEIFIFDPVAEMQDKVDILCPYDMCRLTPTSIWMDGRDNSNNPRQLLDITGPALLVGRSYKCPLHSKFIRTTDAKLLPNTQRYSQDILFCQKMAFKSEFLMSLFQSISVGLSFEKVRETLVSRTLTKFHIARNKYLYDCEQSKILPNSIALDEIKDIWLKMIPSTDAIEDLFKSWFRENEQFFVEDMSSLKASLLSVDHTFKVATNIGGFQTHGNARVWVQLYNSLFIVMNERKEIVSWHFTKKEKFEFVEDLLTKLGERCNEDLHYFISDTCCKWKWKIIEIFGVNILIKLDPFHAIQRIILTIRKKHPFHQQLCDDLKKLFRKPGDYGEFRKDETADPETILSRLDTIVKKWDAMEQEDPEQCLIPQETRNTINNLRKHITAGCCSGIPPNCSSGTNENLHRSLNKFLKGRVMGPELAYALFTVLFFKWNQKLKAANYRFELVSNEIFGMGGSSMQAVESTLDNFLGKWCSNKLIALNHPILTQLTTLQKISSFIKIANLAEIVSKSHKERDTCFRDAVLDYGNVENLLNAGFEKEEFTAHESDNNGLLTTIGKEITKLCSAKKDCGKFLESKGFTIDAMKNLQVLQENQISNIFMAADFIGIVFIVVTSSSILPVLPIFPKNDVYETRNNWIIISYTQQAYAPVKERDVKQPGPKKSRSTCSCGRTSKKENFTSCNSEERKSRCPCLSNESGCLVTCKCSNCANPNGIRPLTKLETSNRQRPAPQLSNKRKTTRDFMSEKDERASKGKWSALETLLLYDLMSNEDDTSVITNRFNKEVKVLRSAHYEVDEKNEAEISSKIQYSKSAREWLDLELKVVI